MPVMLVTDPNGSVGVDPKMAEPVKAMVRELMDRAGVSGAFRIRCGDHRKGTAHFRIRVCPQPNWPLMLIVRPFSNDSAWEWLISPTLPNMEFEPVQNAIRACLDGEPVEAEPQAPAQPPEPTPDEMLRGKLGRAKELADAYRTEQTAIDTLEHECLEAMERVKLLEGKVKVLQAAHAANMKGKAALEFLTNYEALLTARFD